MILVEENVDIGGHGMCSGGQVHLGGGTSNQRKHGVEDSADQVFIDWIRHDHMQSRYSDRDLVRAFADENAATFEFLIENGVEFQDHLTGPTQASRVRRQQRTVQWPVASERVTHHPTRVGSGLVRALEKSARAKGAEVLLRHKMTSIVREGPSAGRVLGITATHDGRTVNIAANKGVLVATGGSTSHVTLRRTFDPRLTEEYQVAGEPWSRQSGDGELAAMAVGASLWGTANQTVEEGIAISKTRHIGCQWGYNSLIWQPDARIFDHARASGLTVADWHDVILVNQTGRRFWNEVDARYDFFAAAMAWNGDEKKLNGGGPIWAIFDQDAVEREEWDPRPPNVDLDGWFFQADTLAELAAAITNPYQTKAIPPAALEETVARYNTFVDGGVDEDFGKPTPRYKIQRPPFLRGLVDADPARLAHRPPHEHEGAGDGHARAGDTGPLLRRRVAGRLRAARARPVPGLRPDRRPRRGRQRRRGLIEGGSGRGSAVTDQPPEAPAPRTPSARQTPSAPPDVVRTADARLGAAADGGAARESRAPRDARTASDERRGLGGAVARRGGPPVHRDRRRQVRVRLPAERNAGRRARRGRSRRRRGPSGGGAGARYSRAVRHRGVAGRAGGGRRSLSDRRLRR